MASFLLFLSPGAHSNTRASFTNKACVFSESDRSEAVGMTRDVLLIRVCELDNVPLMLSIQNALLGDREYVWCKQYIILFKNISEVDVHCSKK